MFDFLDKTGLKTALEQIKAKFPSSLPADGGNADTVNNHTVNTDVPSSAKFTDTTYSNMQAATATASGKAGLVPAPAAGKQTSFLRGDGTWVVPTNTTYNAATQSTNGLMSAADKKKLDGIAAGANNYSLPTATSSVLGGVKIGSNISISSGVISISKTNVTSALGYTPLSSISGVCTKGTTTSVNVTLGWKPSAVIIADRNSPTTLYSPNTISSTGFSCKYIPEGTSRIYWAFK